MRLVPRSLDQIVGYWTDFKSEGQLGFWMNGELILENDFGELVLYEKIKNLGLQGKRGRLEVVVYRESLVSLKMCARARNASLGAT